MNNLTVLTSVASLLIALLSLSVTLKNLIKIIKSEKGEVENLDKYLSSCETKHNYKHSSVHKNYHHNTVKMQH